MATKYEYLTSGDFGFEAMGGIWWQAQLFIAHQDHYVTLVRLKILRDLPPPLPGIITVGIRNVVGGLPVGGDLEGSTGTTDGDTLPLPTDTPSWEWRGFALSPPYPLVRAGNQYAIIFRSEFGVPINNTAGWRWTYANLFGVADSFDSGVTWAAAPPGDGIFEIWGVPVKGGIVALTLSATEIT